MRFNHHGGGQQEWRVDTRKTGQHMVALLNSVGRQYSTTTVLCLPKPIFVVFFSAQFQSTFSFDFPFIALFT